MPLQRRVPRALHQRWLHQTPARRAPRPTQEPLPEQRGAPPTQEPPLPADEPQTCQTPPAQRALRRRLAPLDELQTEQPPPQRRERPTQEPPPQQGARYHPPLYTCGSAPQARSSRHRGTARPCTGTSSVDSRSSCSRPERVPAATPPHPLRGSLGHLQKREPRVAFQMQLALHRRLLELLPRAGHQTPVQYRRLLAPQRRKLAAAQHRNQTSPWKVERRTGTFVLRELR